jgi:hypothetical protein
MTIGVVAITSGKVAAVQAASFKDNANPVIQQASCAKDRLKK